MVEVELGKLVKERLETRGIKKIYTDLLGPKFISEMLRDNAREIVEALVSVLVVKIAEGVKGRHGCLRDRCIKLAPSADTASI
jgi:hypothetical protein